MGWQPTLLILGLVVTIEIHGQQLSPSPDINSSSSKPTLGQALTLECEVPSGFTANSFKWLKDFSELREQTGSTLVFDQLAQSDSGSYRCMYIDQNGGQSGQSGEFSIAVQPPPKPTLDIRGRYFRTNDYVNFNCIVNGSGSQGVDKYMFYKDGNLVQTTRWPNYYPGNLNQSDSGTYTCAASNEVGESVPSDPISITVVGAPTISTSNADAGVGDQMALTCNPPLQLDGIVFRWHKEPGSQVIVGETSQDLTFDSITDADTGEYKCSLMLMFDNSEFQSEMSKSFILVYVVPGKPMLEMNSGSTSILHNKDINAKCRADSTTSLGLLTTSLYLDGVKVAEKKDFFSTSVSFGWGILAQFRNEGNYTCTFTNKIGESPHSDPFNLTVDSWTPNTASISSGLLQTRTSNMFIYCRRDLGQPRPHFCTMFINGTRYQDDKNCNFNIAHGLNGEYFCTASSVDNMGASGSSTIIQVIDKPVVRPITSGPPVEDQDYSLRCVTEPSSGRIVWYSGYGNQLIASDTDTLTFSPFQSSNANRIRCKVGSVYSDFLILTYEVPPKPNFNLNSRGQSEVMSVQNIYDSRNSTMLTCWATNGTEYSLYRDGVKLVSSPTGNFDVFVSSGTGGNFTCTSSNVNGESEHSDWIYVPTGNEIVMTASSPVATLGQPLTLSCEVRGFDGQDVEYNFQFFGREGEMREGQGETRPGQTLTFDPVSESNVGFYSCWARVNNGKTDLRSLEMYIVAFGPPEIPWLVAGRAAGDNDGLHGEPQRRKRQATTTAGSASKADSDSEEPTLTCYVTSLIVDPRNPFKLYKDGALVSTVPYRDYMMFSWRGRWEIQRLYFIDTSVASNAGNYTCTSLNLNGESHQSDPVSVSQSMGSESPRPTITNSNPNAAIGDSVTLTCNLPSKAPQNRPIAWYKDFGPIFNYGRTLNLEALGVEDHGYFICSYFNQSYLDTRSKETSEPALVLARTPLQPLLLFPIPSESEQNAKSSLTAYRTFGVGETVIVNCDTPFPHVQEYRVENLDQGNTYKLLKDGQEVVTGDADGMFQISGLAAGTYSYTCKANNHFGDSEPSFPLPVTVVARPTITASPNPPTLGSDVTLTCDTGVTSDGYDIVWTKNGRTLPNTPTSLALGTLTERDEGIYLCRRKVGPWYHAQSDDYVLAFSTRAPVLYTFYPTTIQAGMRITLNCLTTSSTSSQAVFYQNGAEVATVNMPNTDDVGQVLFTYTILPAAISDTGEYTCKVENSRGVSALSEALTITVTGEAGCNPGFRQVSSGRCEACDYGTYQPDADQNSCIPCNSGLYTLMRAATDDSQCVVVPDSQIIFLRVVMDMTHNAPSDDALKIAVQVALVQAFKPVSYFIGVQRLSVQADTTGKAVVLAAAFFSKDVTLDFTIRLGFKIFNEFYRGDKVSVIVMGGSYEIASVNMYPTAAAAIVPENEFDINECSISPKVCGDDLETCTNQMGEIGSFICSCVDGYVRATAGAECTDINECIQSPNPCTGLREVCVDYIGGYRCDCEAGFTRRTPEEDCSDFDRTQASLYPYGTDKGDTQLSTGDNSISAAITFENGLPYGSEKFNDVYVSTNGMLSLGETLRYYYWGNLEGRYKSGHKIICPLMTDIDTRKGGSVLYQLYEKTTPTPAATQSVLDRAKQDVRANFENVQNFNPDHVLVATWVQVDGTVEYNRWGGLARKRRQADSSAISTFQAVLITDGRTSYLIFMYKVGEFNWPYVRGRSVAVGYVNDLEYVAFVESNSYLTASLDELPGNTGKYGTWIALVGEITNPNQDCANFYIQNQYLKRDAEFQQQVEGLFKCPCSLNQMGRQWRFLEQTEDRTCFALSSLVTRFFTHTRNKICCYRKPNPNTRWWSQRNMMTYIADAPDAGFVTLYDPNPWSNTIRESRLNDLNPHRWCCRDARSEKMCERFYEVRPKTPCSTTAIIISGIALGDPHINTLDGKKYTFNGWGEYIMATIPEKGFMMQGRTDKAIIDGKETKATVFSAVAAREYDVHLQVELSPSKERLIIYADGQDITNKFYDNMEFSESFGEALDINRVDVDNKPGVSAFFASSGVDVSVSLGVESLNVGAKMIETLKSKTSGLLGNFNDDPDDDFQLPDGTSLPSVRTERQIFEQFGRAWEVTPNNTVFNYPQGETAADYSHSEFVPMFREEIDQTVLQEAQTKCGAENDACIFDFIATGSQEFADATKRTDEEGDETRSQLANRMPEISLSTTPDAQGRIVVEEGQTIDIRVTATDEDGHTVTFELESSHTAVSIDSNSGVITYLPDPNRPVAISVFARDSEGGLSSLLAIPVVVCTRCSGHGSCDRSKVRPELQEGGKFQKFVCDCRPAWTGPECESEFNACADNPCSQGQKCEDTRADLQDGGNPSHTCGPCPSGLQLVDNKCTDLDECTASPPPCALCTNTIGSYECSCEPGFRQDPGDMHVCKDIDECQENTHNCEHECTNIPGSFTCVCIDGYTLQADGHSCLRTASSSVCDTSACQQVCAVSDTNTPVCSCNAFYTTDLQDTDNCVDVDECAAVIKPCNQLCKNLEKGFECSCRPGYKLAEDKTTCKECESPNYGDNCAQVCTCGRGGERCDPVRGCVCRPGFAGPNCEDINECLKEDDMCGSNEECVNTIGSYKCKCSEGYEPKDGKCVDIFECRDPLLYTCKRSENKECINTEGSYRCDCLPGYVEDSTGMCKDDDECTTGAHDCIQHCVNMPGSYNCECFYGYRLDDTRTKCVLSKDVCREFANLTCGHGCSYDLDNQRAFCFCNSGYSLNGDGQTCDDIDECANPDLNKCSEPNLCKNTPGGYKCSCQAGFMLDNDGRTCRACAGGTWGVECLFSCGCSKNADRCDPVQGCVCNNGYTGDKCDKDIDECSEDSTLCVSPYVCVNQPGTHSCQCPRGYKKNEATGGCDDINECSSRDVHNCDQDCENFDGGYRCTCSPGFTLDVAVGRCVDVDECQKETDRCDGGCQNTQGSYRCTCGDGYKLNVDGATCLAATECQPTNTCADKCAVVNGQETCSCPRGQMVAGVNNDLCEDIDLCATDPCRQNCMETDDGTEFVCSCEPGFALAGDTVSCDACKAGTFGEGCSSSCDCITENALPAICRPNDGVCLCKPGWTGPKCNQDVDECMMAESPCKGGSRCRNKIGSYECFCDPGFIIKNRTSGICEECDNGFYGEGCTSKCTCDPRTSDCNNELGCQCHMGWEGDVCRDDIDECAQGSDDCDTYTPSASCVNTEGSYRCDCQDGFEPSSVPKTCKDINECDGVPAPCDHLCDNNEGSYQCRCRNGYQLVGRARCEDVDECSTGAANCNSNTEDCVNNLGSFECNCKDGYRRDSNQVCVDVDECSTGAANCNSNTEDCVNNPGSFECNCKDGYRRDSNQVCVERDYCAERTPCGPNENCENIQGGHQCTCKAGYVENQSGVCSDIDECSENTDNCGANENCVNTEPGFRCDCKSGYERNNNNECVDKDECATQTSNCNARQTCQNKPGTFECVCKDGYTSTQSGDCEDIDECAVGTANCGNNKVCVNMEPDFRCDCKSGYELDNNDACVDINECAVGSDTCNDRQNCQNGLGAFECICKDGYREVAGGDCEDINECTANTDNCGANEECVNTEPGFRCDCESGYEKNNNGACVDINECTRANPCSSRETCQNTPGGHTCTCKPGYEKQAEACVDIDECTRNTDNCADGEPCFNTVGGFTCGCEPGQEVSPDGQCFVPYKKSCGLRFPNYNPSDAALTEGTAENLRIVDEIRQAMIQHFKKTIEAFKDFIISRMSKGSLIVEGVVIIDSEANSNPTGDIAKALSDLDRETITVDGQPQTDMETTLAGAVVSPTSDQCVILQQVEPCTGEEMCRVGTDGVASCQRYESDDDDTDMWVGIGIGAGVAAIIIFGTIIAACVHFSQKKKSYSSRSGRYAA